MREKKAVIERKKKSCDLLERGMRETAGLNTCVTLDQLKMDCSFWGFFFPEQ